jgi:hypothetical protein
MAVEPTKWHKKHATSMPLNDSLVHVIIVFLFYFENDTCLEACVSFSWVLIGGLEAYCGNV